MNFFVLFFLPFLTNAKAVLPTYDVKWTNIDIVMPLGSDLNDYSSKPKATLYLNGVWQGSAPTYTRGVDATSLSTVNTDVPLKYVVVYQAKFSDYGVTFKQSITFYVEDNEAPSFISRLDDINVLVNSPEPHLDANILYKDNYSLYEEIKLVIDKKTLDMSKVGKYQIIYSITDSSNNMTVKMRNVNVIDNIAPVAEVDGIIYVPFNRYDFDLLEGIKVTDNYDGDITSKAIVSTKGVNFSRIGRYELSYQVSDSSGNKTVFKRYIQIVDLEPPEIHLANYSIRVGINYVLTLDYFVGLILEVTDNYSSINPDDVQIMYNLGKRYGVYNVVFHVYDDARNYGEAIFKVYVVDMKCPVLEGENKNILINEVFDPFAHIKATDNLDGNIINRVIVEKSNVNPCVEGIYYTVYSVYDSSGNYTEKTLFFNVMKKIDYSKLETTNNVYIPSIPYDTEEKVETPLVEDGEEINSIYYVAGIIIAVLGGVLFFIVWRHKRKKHA